MSNISVELTNFYGYDHMTVKGEGFDLGGCVLTAPGLTMFDLATKYDKYVTAMVDGRAVGWAGISSAIHFICNEEKHKKNITEVTWWGSERCIYHLKLLYALTGEDANDLLPDDELNNKEAFPNKTAKKSYLSRCFGRTLPRSKNKHEIICKPLNHI
jgi:hypothetical protein